MRFLFEVVHPAEASEIFVENKVKRFQERVGKSFQKTGGVL